MVFCDFSFLAELPVNIKRDVLYFSILDGPAWLTVTDSGSLYGNPGSDNVGLNTWFVEVTDNKDGSDTAYLEIYVNELQAFVEQTAASDVVVAGTLAGTFLSTQDFDGSYPVELSDY